MTAAVAAGLVGAATPPEMIKELLAQRVEEDGKNLSGGIGKAIAFARIFVKPTADLSTARLFGPAHLYQSFLMKQLLTLTTISSIMYDLFYQCLLIPATDIAASVNVICQA